MTDDDNLIFSLLVTVKMKTSASATDDTDLVPLASVKACWHARSSSRVE